MLEKFLVVIRNIKYGRFERRYHTRTRLRFDGKWTSEMLGFTIKVRRPTPTHRILQLHCPDQTFIFG